MADWFSGSPSSVNTTSLSNLTPEMSSMLQSLMQYMQPYTANPSAIPSYTGQFTAPLTDAQTGAMSNVSGLSNLPASGDTLSQIMNMISGKAFDPTSETKAYTEGVEKPMIENFNRDIMPKLDSSYSKAGLFYSGGGAGSGSRGDATQVQSETLMDAITMGRSNLQAKEDSEKLATQQSGITDFSNFLTNQNNLSSSLFNMGTQEQTTNQNDLNALLQQWQQQNIPGDQPMDQLLTSLLGLKPTDNQTAVTPASTGAGTTIVSSVATAAGAAAAAA
jgi:hypothetical protein